MLNLFTKFLGLLVCCCLYLSGESFPVANAQSVSENSSRPNRIGFRQFQLAQQDSLENDSSASDIVAEESSGSENTTMDSSGASETNSNEETDDSSETTDESSNETSEESSEKMSQDADQDKDLKGSRDESTGKSKKEIAESPISIKWFQTEFMSLEDPKGKKRKRKVQLYKVTLQGRLEKNAKIFLGKRTFFVRHRSVKRYVTTKLLRKKSRRVGLDKDGYFKIPLYVPEGLLQVPILLRKGKKRDQFKVQINVTKESAVVKDAEVLYKPCENCLWIGVGVGVLAYQQAPPDTLQPVNYGSFSLPNFSMKGSFTYTEKLNWRFDFHQLSGDDLTTSDPTVTITDAKIGWTYFGIESEYKAFSRKTLFGKAFQPGMLLGVQSQSVPFVVGTGGSNFKIGDFNFYSVSFGGMMLLNPEKRLQYEAFMRLQVAIPGSGQVSLTGGYAFDGSVGLIYHLTEKWKLGAFWNGQLHNYNYSHNSSIGTYTLFSSNLDFSIGYQF